ncbi:MAG: type II toxin-antitoxin system VapC family toxin [Alphaproteobacteria bacterium]|jgi:predicted nucleic acid-binding protein|nr:type II toxin-antitoxin system VapC family toxin [Alphaproteobacteria bacterium]
MPDVLVDANVLIDIMAPDPVWADWSQQAVLEAGHRGRLIINPIILAEVSACHESRERVERLLPPNLFVREHLPWAAAFPAGQAFVAYRRAGGTRTAPLPDFYIGAHAQVKGHAILTRDTRRYRTHFPGVPLVCPG